MEPLIDRRKLQENGAAVTELVIEIEIDGAANRKVLEESCKKNGTAVSDLVIDHEVDGVAYRKVLEESCKKNGAAVSDLVIDHEVDGAAYRKVRNVRHLQRLLVYALNRKNRR
jgi:hypothetical protein